MKTFVLVLCIHCFLIVAAQPSIQWQKTIGGQMDDALRVAAKFTNGDVVLAGSSPSNISGEKGENSRGANDFWVLRISLSNEVVWQRTIGGSGSDGLNACILSPDSILLAGLSWSDISGEKNEACRGANDYWLVNLNLNGDILWQKTIGGDSADILMSAAPTSDDGYIIGGMSVSGISGEKTEPIRGFCDYWILKLDAAGNIQWQKTYGGDALDNLTKVKQLADGGFIVTGNSGSDASFDKTEDCRGDFDFWLLRLDEVGNIVWQRTIGGLGQDVPEDVLEMTDGTIVVAGWSDSDISGEKTENSKGGVDFWMVRLDASGNIINQKTIGGNDFDQSKTLVATSDNGFIVAGSSTSPISGDKSEDNCGGSDAWMLKLDQDFEVLWQKTIGGELSDGIADVEITDIGILLGGNSRSSIACDKTEVTRGGNDYWVIELEPDDLSVPSIRFDEVSLAPNPTEGNVNVSFAVPFSGTMELIDEVGKILESKKLIDKSETSVFISQPSGVYFIKLRSGLKSSVFKILKK